MSLLLPHQGSELFWASVFLFVYEMGITVAPASEEGCVKDITKTTLQLSMHKLTVVIIENNAASPTCPVKKFVVKHQRYTEGRIA